MTTSKKLAVLLCGALLLAGCGSSQATPKPATTSSTPSYQKLGPHEVSVTTLDLGSAGSVLGERLATVYYPTTRPSPGLSACTASYSYRQSDTLPASLKGVLPSSYDTVQTVPGTLVGCVGGAGVQASGGPYPVLLFSHGYGGERLYYSNLLAGIASWGYVVVSADYLERGLASQALKGTPKATPALDRSIMLASLDAVIAASKSPSSLLSGAVDPSKVAAAGHSMGGQTAFDALRSPRIATAIGWAPVGPAGSPADKPTMIIGATADSAVKLKDVRGTYASFHAPKSLVEVTGLGHNTYTDICVGIRSGGGLINFAVDHHFVSAQLAKLGINGCEAKDAPPSEFWPIVQYYTVFQLKNVFAGTAATKPVPTPAAGFSPLHVEVTQQS